VTPGGRGIPPSGLEHNFSWQRKTIVQGPGSFVDGFTWMDLMGWSRICWN